MKIPYLSVCLRDGGLPLYPQESVRASRWKWGLAFHHLTLQWQMTYMRQCSMCTKCTCICYTYIIAYTCPTQKNKTPGLLSGTNSNICCVHFSASVSSLYSDTTDSGQSDWKWADWVQRPCHNPPPPNVSLSFPSSWPRLPNCFWDSSF